MPETSARKTFRTVSPSGTGWGEEARWESEGEHEEGNLHDTLAAADLQIRCADTVNPVVSFASASLGFDLRPFTLGYEFTTSIPMDINALGYWNDGLQNSHEVGLWDASGTLLGSANVLASDAYRRQFSLAADFEFYSQSRHICGRRRIPWPQ